MAKTEIQKIISRNHYLRNKDEVAQKAIARRAASRSYVQEQKDNPCMDCGIRYPYYVMEYDHREDKIDTVSRMVRNGSGIRRIKEEILKCDLVCSNCHRIRTHERTPNYIYPGSVV